MQLNKFPIEILKIINKYYNEIQIYYYGNYNNIIKDERIIKKYCLICEKNYYIQIEKKQKYFFEGSIFGLCDNCIQKKCNCILL